MSVYAHMSKWSARKRQKDGCSCWRDTNISVGRIQRSNYPTIEVWWMVRWRKQSSHLIPYPWHRHEHSIESANHEGKAVDYICKYITYLGLIFHPTYFLLIQWIETERPEDLISSWALFRGTNSLNWGGSEIRDQTIKIQLSDCQYYRLHSWPLDFGRFRWFAESFLFVGFYGKLGFSCVGWST